MKRTFGIIMAFAMLFMLVACGNTNVNGESDNAPISDLAEKYPGYYVGFDEGIISVTNYDPDDLNNLPSYQEVIDYGDGAGLEYDGVVYYIYVFDAAASSEGNEKYYYAELADGTMEVLIEEDNYFSSEEERKEVVDKLIEMMNYVRDDSNE